MKKRRQNAHKTICITHRRYCFLVKNSNINAQHQVSAFRHASDDIYYYYLLLLCTRCVLLLWEYDEKY